MEWLITRLLIEVRHARQMRSVVAPLICHDGGGKEEKRGKARCGDSHDQCSFHHRPRLGKQCRHSRVEAFTAWPYNTNRRRQNATSTLHDSLVGKRCKVLRSPATR